LDDSGKQYLSRNIIVRFRNAIFGLRSVRLSQRFAEEYRITTNNYYN